MYILNPSYFVGVNWIHCQSSVFCLLNSLEAFSLHLHRQLFHPGGFYDLHALANPRSVRGSPLANFLIIHGLDISNRLPPERGKRNSEFNRIDRTNAWRFRNTGDQRIFDLLKRGSQFGTFFPGATCCLRPFLLRFWHSVLLRSLVVTCRLVIREGTNGKIQWIGDILIYYPFCGQSP
jgi:hypothetical protein